MCGVSPVSLITEAGTHSRHGVIFGLAREPPKSPDPSLLGSSESKYTLKHEPAPRARAGVLAPGPPADILTDHRTLDIHTHIYI